MELETTQNRVEELFNRNAGGLYIHVVVENIKLIIFFIFHRVGEKEIQSLKEKNHRYHMEEMMVKLKMEQIKKLTENECKRVYTMAQQRDEITWVRVVVVIT